MVLIDPKRGPTMYKADESVFYFDETSQRPWDQILAADQKLLVQRAAKANRCMEGVFAERRAIAAAAEITPEQRVQRRCQQELQRTSFSWNAATMEDVMANHQKPCRGLFYGMVFPWSEQTLESMGPAWLTKAFHRAGTMAEGNEVLELKLDKKVTAGNNAGKFIFEVRYKWQTPDLHCKLFAKIPFPYSGATTNDRLSSSVNKQPMDFFEVNAYRLFEASMPVKIPKYYFGDISNESTNFILITECIPFAGYPPLPAFKIEGPYVKCKDFEMAGSEKEHYLLLMQVHGRIGAAAKRGDLGSEELLATQLSRPNLQALTVSAEAATGGHPKVCATGLRGAIKFFAATAQVLYPEFVMEDAFQEKFFRTMMTLNAYAREISLWKSSDADYVALGHLNLNVDNAFFWRDGEGGLDCGIFDLGGFGAAPMHHRIWWGLNCAEFPMIRQHLEEFLTVFIETYESQGGPKLDFDQLKAGVILTALENMSYMVASIPNCLKMCGTKEWPTIKDRHDPRIADDVGGKSTLRTTLLVLYNGLCVLEEFQADQVLAKWIQDTFVGSWGLAAKSDDVIFAGESR
ncbi:unnamed protein product [Effrenium voratum]|nr:unnamed protein product [Effrenium voratum]